MDKWRETIMLSVIITMVVILGLILLLLAIYKPPERALPLIQPSAMLIQFENDPDANLDFFLLDQMLRERQSVRPPLPPMPVPRYIPPIYLHQDPCP